MNDNEIKVMDTVTCKYTGTRYLVTNLNYNFQIGHPLTINCDLKNLETNRPIKLQGLNHIDFLIKAKTPKKAQHPLTKIFA